MAADKKNKKPKKKTSKGEIILILALAIIFGLCVAANFIVPDIVNGKNPLDRFKKAQTEEVTDGELSDDDENEGASDEDADGSPDGEGADGRSGGAEDENTSGDISNDDTDGMDGDVSAGPSDDYENNDLSGEQATNDEDNPGGVSQIPVLDANRGNVGTLATEPADYSGNQTYNVYDDVNAPLSANVDEKIVGTWSYTIEGHEVTMIFNPNGTGQISADGRNIRIDYGTNGSTLTISYYAGDTLDSTEQDQYSVSGDKLTISKFQGQGETIELTKR